jgi:hypothetical protein
MGIAPRVALATSRRQYVRTPFRRRAAALDRKKPVVPRRVWRMSPEAPLGTVVDVDLSAPPAAAPEAAPKILKPPPVPDWRGSSWDLLNGLEVRDHSETIPDAVFEQLFKR